MAGMDHSLTTNLIDKLAYVLAVKNGENYPKCGIEIKNRLILAERVLESES